jgi:hypothetical protein
MVQVGGARVSERCGCARAGLRTVRAKSQTKRWLMISDARSPAPEWPRKGALGKEPSRFPLYRTWHHAPIRARCSAVEWRSLTPNALAFSRAAHVTMFTDGNARKSRKPSGSHTSGARLTSCRFCYYVSRDSLNRRRVGDCCSVHVFTQPGHLRLLIDVWSSSHDPEALTDCCTAAHSSKGPDRKSTGILIGSVAGNCR